MFAEARQMGSVWFWLFQFLLVLVMLNMLLAIIMDTYADVKAKSSHVVTLPEQLGILLRRARWIRRGEGLPLLKIDQKLSQLFGAEQKDESSISTVSKWAPSDVITINGLVNVVDGLDFPQAERLVTLAVKKWRLEHLTPLSLTEAMNLISLIHRHLMDQSRTLAQIHHYLDNQQHSASEGQHSINQSFKVVMDSSVDKFHEPEVTKEGERMDNLELELKKTNAKLDTMEAKMDAKFEKMEKTMEKMMMLIQMQNDKKQHTYL
eukprot:gnl/MRDRNA2_/MRDRNA2_20202_c0_seq1.p1 gnl/MRDRNA2_/MRDRNA2_20202_c0~~gnl/MRDRNA2_/MRDRNA2_20202_c0_seq1.p1  ORF type:complete len:300 (+),score=60.80 gnl/MRDRNA2_/MRDRNA2_20202_c0_seq1:112-900(+)